MDKINSFLFEILKLLFVVITLAALVRFFIFSPILVDGHSMEPTLHDEDRMIVNKLTYKISKPKRFDIIIFHAPENKDYIKRVIGLPGDFVEYRDDTLYINGKAVEEPYLDAYKAELIEGKLTDDFDLHDIDPNLDEIPPGYIFVMGDNRRFSKDSRQIGIVSQKEIVGKSNIIFWPLNDLAIIE